MTRKTGGGNRHTEGETESRHTGARRPREAEKGWHRNGVRKPKDGAKTADVIVLPRTVGSERNLLCVPLSVLHAKAARSLQQIVYSWVLKTGEPMLFTFSRTGDNPFPQSQHAFYLDILLAMFASKFRKDGVLHFRLSDVLRAAGKNPRSQGAKEAVVEAIRRYMRCHVIWETSWRGRKKSWAGAIIKSSNLWDENGNPVTLRSQRNPRNDHDIEKWHTVAFHDYIVESVEDGNTRIFLTSILSSGIPHDAFLVYRYFYGFSDRTEVKRPIEQLMMAFPWTSRPSRFPPWLEKQLKELLKRSLIDYYSSNGGWVTVKCKPISELEKKGAHEPQGTTVVVDEVPKDARPVNDPPPKRQGATRKRVSKVTNLPDEALLAHYFELRDAGKLPPYIVKVVDDLVEQRLKDLYLPALRSYLGHADA